MLDRRSDDLAGSILAPLNARQRERLVAALAEVEPLLVASMVEISRCDPRHPYARFCITSYLGELGRRFPDGFDAARSISADDAELTPQAGLLLVATLHEEPVGCGALKFHGTRPAAKRMWVAESVRGLGLGRRMLAELEQRAAANAVDTLRLETNGNLVEAVALYRSSGYREVPAFNDEPYAHHWFEKRPGAEREDPATEYELTLAPGSCRAGPRAGERRVRCRNRPRRGARCLASPVPRRSRL